MVSDGPGSNLHEGDEDPSPGHRGHAAARAPEAGSLLVHVRELLTEAGLYDPQELAAQLRLTPVDEAVVIDWGALASLPPTGTRQALRMAILEVLTAAGLDASYGPPPSADSSGTITVTRPPIAPGASH